MNRRMTLLLAVASAFMFVVASVAVARSASAAPQTTITVCYHVNWAKRPSTVKIARVKNCNSYPIRLAAWDGSPGGAMAICYEPGDYYEADRSMFVTGTVGQRCSPVGSRVAVAQGAINTNYPG
jgi:hypothetical protein